LFSTRGEAVTTYSKSEMLYMARDGASASMENTAGAVDTAGGGMVNNGNEKNGKGVSERC
jgi:hypothetical protein